MKEPSLANGTGDQGGDVDSQGGLSWAPGGRCLVMEPTGPRGEKSDASARPSLLFLVTSVTVTKSQLAEALSHAPRPSVDRRKTEQPLLYLPFVFLMSSPKGEEKADAFQA